MASENEKDRRLTAYLLGQLSEAERTEVEDRYFADDALFEYLAAVETELIDAYARGELPEPDRLRRFLGSPRLRARIAFARRLQARTVALLGKQATPATGQRTASPHQPAPSKAATRSVSPLIGVAAAVVTGVAVVAGWWMFKSARPQATVAVDIGPSPAAGQAPIALSLPPARLQPITAPLKTAAAGPVSLVLSINNRDNAELTMPAGSDVVRIEIDHDGPGYERYAVIVSTKDRHRVLTESSLSPRAPGASGVILEAPVLSLPPGTYLVTLSGGAADARRLKPVADYSLRVR